MSEELKSRVENILNSMLGTIDPSELLHPQSRVEAILIALDAKIQELSELSGKIPIHICTSGEYNQLTGIPTIENPETDIFYLVPDGSGNNIYTEWIYTGDRWEYFSGQDQKIPSEIPAEVSSALLNIFRHVAYTDNQGQAYYDALYAALYQDVIPSGYPRLDVVYYNPSTITVDKSALTKLNGYIMPGSRKIDIQDQTRLVYFACLPNTKYHIHKMLSSRYRVAYTTAKPAQNISVSGYAADNNATELTLTTGSDARYAVIYYYDGANDTLSESEIYDSLEITYGGHVVYTDDALDTLRPYLTVKWLESADDSSTVVTDYTLSGTLVDGQSTVMVRKDGLVTAVQVEAVDFYNRSVVEYPNSDKTVVVSGKQFDASNVNGYIKADTNRSAVCVIKGDVAMSSVATDYQPTDYYGIPFPDGATKATVEVSPATLYLYISEFHKADGAASGLIRIESSNGWVQSSCTFTATKHYDGMVLGVNIKENSAGDTPVTTVNYVKVMFS